MSYRFVSRQFLSRIATCRVYRNGIRYNSTQLKGPQLITTDELPQIVTEVTKSKIKDEGETKKAPPIFNAIRALIDRYKDHVVLVQMGGFYELYFEHAEKYAPQLDIRIARRKYKNTDKFSFAGFPLASLDKYLKILVKDLGYSVAVADQFSSEDLDDPTANRITRRVTRIVTPGTLIDEALRNFQQNNYLLSISFPENACKKIANPDLKIGLAWSDIALGDFYVQETTLQNLMTTITKIRPSEILLNENLADEQLDTGRWYPELSELKRFYVRYQNLPINIRPIKSFYHMFNDDQQTLDRCFNELTHKEISASISALYYITETLPESEPNLALPERQILSATMQIDSRTSDALELHKTFRDDKKTGSLISSIKTTVTQSGARLLSAWISAPSTSVSEIRRRQKIVDLFRKKSELRSITIHNLKRSSDISRIVQRFSLGKADVSELCALANTLMIVDEMKEFFEEQSDETKLASKILKPIIANLSSPIDLAKEILDVVDEEAILRNIRARELVRQQTDNLDKLEEVEEEEDTSDNHELNVEDWAIRKEANLVLRRCHDEYENLLEKKKELLENLTDTFVSQQKCRSVVLQLHKVYGYVVCVNASQKVLSGITSYPAGFRLLYSTKQSRLFHLEEWKIIGTDIQSHIDRIRLEEARFLTVLRRKVLLRTFEIRNVAHTLDYIDVLSSFAVLALEKNLTIPKVTTTQELDIVGGRHIVVEDGLKGTARQFTPNDCHLNTDENPQCMWIVSGPNMGGKSTFLRQNAIIVILTQIGSFVPAESATIGIVDKVFSRIGSADDLYREMSTFMVEMVETSFILKNSTPRSLAILDEIGRGTSGKEGLAIAFATLLHLLRKNNSRCLFATHFGVEISKLLDTVDEKEKIEFYRTSIEKIAESGNAFDDRFIFDHKLSHGISPKSHAIDVAQLAGFPEPAIEFAKKSLDRLERGF